MIDKRASLAPISPPETGASTLKHPFELAALSISLARFGSLVLISTMMPFFFAAYIPSRTPLELKITSRTSRG